MEGDDGDECAVEVAASGDGDAAVRLEEGRKEGRKEWIVLKCLLEMEMEKKEEEWSDSVKCWVRMEKR